MKNTDYTTIACVALGTLAAITLGGLCANALSKAYAEEDIQDEAFLTDVLEELLIHSRTAHNMSSPMSRTMIKVHLALATNTYNRKHGTKLNPPSFTVYGNAPTKQVVIKSRRTECSGFVYCR